MTFGSLFSGIGGLDLGLERAGMVCEWQVEMSRPMMTVGSLFSGIGGLDLGLERAGMQIAWQCEINDYARRVLAKHWPDVRRHDDVHTFPVCDGTDWSVDLIAGGDPCQENSRATGGNRSIESSLGAEFIRIVDALRPRFVLRENPHGTRANAPWPWFRMRSLLESLGYAVLPFRLRACCFGAFHRRDRVFLLAERADAHGIRLEGWQEKTQGRNASESQGRIHPGDWLALSASRGLRSRAGFPGYVDRVKGIGNAIVPQVAEWIGRRLMDSA